MPHDVFLRQAIDLAVESAASGGGPFGVVIVKDGKVIASGTNAVTKNNDPTAHAEIIAIRAACDKLNSFQLEGCDIYSSCEPCPMCLGAIYWARPKAVYYASTRQDAADAGFDDEFIYEELSRDLKDRKLPLVHLQLEGANESFRIWKGNDKRVEY